MFPAMKSAFSTFSSFSTIARAAALLTLPVLLAVAPARASGTPLQEARAALDALRAKHAAAGAVSVSFRSRALGADGSPMPAVKGSLVTADSGRFRLEHAQGVVVSDGATLWQYAPSTGQVILRPAAAAGGAGGVLRRFLDARAVKAEPAGNDLRVALDPASVGESLDSLVITVTRDGSAARRVETQDPAGHRVTYELTSVRYDARPAREAFTFRPPADAEIVDMR